MMVRIRALYLGIFSDNSAFPEYFLPILPVPLQLSQHYNKSNVFISVSFYLFHHKLQLRNIVDTSWIFLIHTLYILFFVCIGTNSSFNCIPNPCASFFTILRLGFLVPFSIRLISACVIPVLADKSFCVIFCYTLASIIAWIISYSGCNASYSAFISGFCNAFFYNLYSYSLPYLRS